MAAVLEYFLTGGAANANPDLSLGGDTSSVNVNSTALNNLFANVLPTDILLAEYVTYRAFAIKNTGDAEARHVDFYLTDTLNTESDLYIWYDSTGTQSIADDETEPTGASGNWIQPLEGSKYSLANLAAGAEHRIWIRRRVDALATNLNDDLGTLHSWFS